MPKGYEFEGDVDDTTTPCRLGGGSCRMESILGDSRDVKKGHPLSSQGSKAPKTCKFKNTINDTAIPCRLGGSHRPKAALEASPDLKKERPLFSKHLEPPHGFGPLPTIRDQPRGPLPRHGVHNFISAREKVVGKPSTHRKNSVINNAIDHPEFNAYYNFDGRKADELTTFEKNVLEMAVHYPNIQNGIMKAPLYFRTGSFTQPRAEQPDLVSQVFGTPELFDKIVGHLIARYEDLANLCATSQFIADKVQSFWMHLDATNNRFLGWDRDTLVDIRKKEAEEEVNGSRKAQEVQKHFFSPSVIISPVRSRHLGPSREVIVNKAGYPMTSSVKGYQETDFASSMMAHYKLLHLVHLNGHFIKHLILHGMPWLNIETLQRIVPEMIRLEALGVHQCFLLTLGDAQPLLNAVNNINEERAKLNQPHIAVDFTPFYYRGPPYKSDGSGHVGEYGIVPDDKEWLHSTAAVTAQLLGIWDLCHKGNQDFFTPGTGFRSFLNRLPVRTMESILKSIENIHDYKMQKHYSGVVDLFDSCTTGTYYAPGHSKPLVSEEMRHAMEVTVWQDLIISSKGKPMLRKELENFIMSRGKLKLTHCVECKTDMPACYFMSDILRRRPQDLVCHGCQLGLFLAKHKWRLYKQRRDLAKSIFTGKRFKELPLKKVLKNISKPEVSAVIDKSGQEFIPAQDAIISRPGMVDSYFHKEAEQLWRELTIYIPRRIEKTRADIRIIDETYGSLSYDDRCAASTEREALQRHELQLEYVLGTNQHNRDNGSLERLCRSWELDMRDYRAELALEKGAFVNKAPIPIFNLKENVASMLGRSGGLSESWRDSSWEEEAASKDKAAATRSDSMLSLSAINDSGYCSSQQKPENKQSSSSTRTASVISEDEWPALQKITAPPPTQTPPRPAASQPVTMHQNQQTQQAVATRRAPPRNRILRIVKTTTRVPTTPSSSYDTTSPQRRRL
ncbi:hypothetical protein F5Y09DRAFT_353963 [Xylaria sp. FL1042]|nr:hypothetical protein F5Y09DRAFT_353963 [Xylaria sp. FL1042]